jgi:hypothetical protein
LIDYWVRSGPPDDCTLVDRRVICEPARNVGQ